MKRLSRWPLRLPWRDIGAAVLTIGCGAASVGGLGLVAMAPVHTAALAAWGGALMGLGVVFGALVARLLRGGEETWRK